MNPATKVSRMEYPTYEYIENVTIPNIFQNIFSLKEFLTHVYNDPNDPETKARILIDVFARVSDRKLTPEAFNTIIDKLTSVKMNENIHYYVSSLVPELKRDFYYIYLGEFSTVIENIANKIENLVKVLIEQFLTVILVGRLSVVLHEFFSMVDEDINNKTTRSVDFFNKYFMALKRYFNGEKVEISEVLKDLGVQSAEEVAKLLDLYKPKKVIDDINEIVRDAEIYLGMLTHSLS